MDRRRDAQASRFGQLFDPLGQYDALASDGVYTYAVGLEGSNESDMDAIAKAGGTTKGFFIGSGNAQADLLNFKRKVDAGANGAITQYFYNPDAYFSFIDTCEKNSIDIPVVPGIMPITNFHQLARFSDACGAEIPRWIRKRLQAFGEDMASIRAFGEDVVTELCAHLLEQGAPGLHFYTMNRAEPSMKIWKHLNLKDV